MDSSQMPEDDSLHKCDSFASQHELTYHKQDLLISRTTHPQDTVIKIKDVTIGGNQPVIIAGPCSVESEECLLSVAQELSKHGVKILRGGAFKPRTSPYSFQGLGNIALEYLHNISNRCQMISICEVMDPRDIELTSNYIDILQIGSRNMANYSLLREVSHISKPILLKRGMGSTIEEFLYAAEYILSGGNSEVILCERGIRTFESQTRFTLDLAAVAILQKETHLPIIADVSHSSGRRDLVIPLSRASLAVGADGIMVEVHPDPPNALSDSNQQINFLEFHELLANILPFMKED